MTTTPPDAAFYEALVVDDATELYEHAPCAYLSTLPDGTIVKANATFSAWTGFDRAEVVGCRRFQDLLAPGDRIFFETHYAPLLRLQGHVREIAVELVGRDGARLPVLVNAVVRAGEGGAPPLVRAVLFDATERRAYERELLEARRKAEESERRALTLARTLQESFLPPAVLDVPGLDVAGAFRPAGDGSEVGGDFYDVFDTGRGTTAVVLGDVCGKGAGAAVLTSLARATVRAEALRTPSPGAVLQGVHEAMVRFHPDRFLTAVLLSVRSTSTGVRLTAAVGGHDLPLRMSAGGHVDTIGTPGTILGMIERARLTDTTVALAPGDVVVLVTDGVTEARRGRELFGFDGLAATVRAYRGCSAQELADAIITAALEVQDGQARDDMAVVVVRVPS